MELNNNEIFCLIELLEEEDIYPIEPYNIGDYLINEGQIKNKMQISEGFNKYHQIGEDTFIDIFSFKKDIKKFKKIWIENNWIRKNYGK